MHMTIALTVPAPLEEVVQCFDGREDPFTEYDVGSELKAARGKLTDPSEAENLGAWAEVLAFALSAEPGSDTPWGTRFGPMGSGVNGEGRTVYFPDIAGTPDNVVGHWAHRARSLKNPYLKARYADPAWDMSGPLGKRKRDPEDARLAIDNYLAALPRVVEMHERLVFAIRALDLAATLGDNDRVERARLGLMELHRQAIVVHEGLWWYAPDRLMDDKKVGVTDAERAELVSDLESLLKQFSDQTNPELFNQPIRSYRKT